MVQEALGSTRFEIGRVISTSLAVFGRNLVPFVILALVIGIPYILVSFWGAISPEDIEAIQASGQLPPGFWGMIIVAVLIFMLTNALTQSAIVFGTFQDLRGQRASIGECLARGLASMPRVVVAAILASIGIMIGAFLLFVPGVILMLMWWVFVPVLVVEGAGIMPSFGRSRELTRGHRWAILGLLFVVGIAQWLVSLVIGLVAGLLGAFVAELVNLIVMLFFSAFASVMTAVGYFYLRVEKEGIVIDDIARVFD
jgi:MFS family permease